MVVFYPVSAILTIFCNVLLNPGGAHVMGDLELLSRAPRIIRMLRVRKQLSTSDDTMQLNMLDDFLAELSRLGVCAVNKARLALGDSHYDPSTNISHMVV
jgi:hypothetical protein